MNHLKLVNLIPVMELKQAKHYNYCVVFLLLCSYYVTDIIKKLELHILLVIILFKIEFGHELMYPENFSYWYIAMGAQILAPQKRNIPFSKIIYPITQAMIFLINPK